MFHPAKAGAVLDALTRNMGVRERLEPYRAWKVWAEVVGPQTAQHAQPFRLRGGVLEVRVDHPVWMQQLQLLKPRILERLNLAIAPGVLEDIHLRHGQPEIPAVVTPSEEIASRALTPAEEEELNRLLPPDEDELHNAWRKLLVHYLQSKSSSGP
jgi:predicted nucleic acid-binding Zn ribbon protein